MGTVIEKPVRVGLPCALLYYEFGATWRSFLEVLGADPVESGPTTRARIERGLSAALDEACLPVKAAYGHCLDLARKVQVIFLPRVVSVESRAYSCPKLLGVSDMIRLALPSGVTLLDPTIDLSRGSDRCLWAAAELVGRSVGAGPDRIHRAAVLLSEGMVAYGRGAPAKPSRGGGRGCGRGRGRGEGQLAGAPRNGDSRTGIGLVGHPYNLYDPGLNLDIASRLASLGAEVKVPEDYTPGALESASERALKKPLFWTLGKRLIAAAALMARDPAVHGIVSLASFGCGPDSLTLELASRHVRRAAKRKPFMLLTLDEHTGEAGLLTRIEAFVDLVVRRRRAV